MNSYRTSTQQPSSELLRRFFHPTMKKMVSSTHALRRKTKTSPVKPRWVGIWGFSDGKGTVYLDSNLYLYVFFPYTKIIKNPKYAGRSSNYSNICLKQKPFDHKVISAVPFSHPAPPESYVELGSPPRMLVRGEGLGWDPPNLKI